MAAFSTDKPPLRRTRYVPAAAQHQDKSNDLIQTDFNFRVQAYGVRMAGKSLSVLKRHIGGRTAP
jgi:hypothetical protein